MSGRSWRAKHLFSQSPCVDSAAFGEDRAVLASAGDVLHLDSVKSFNTSRACSTLLFAMAEHSNG